LALFIQVAGHGCISPHINLSVSNKQLSDPTSTMAQNCLSVGTRELQALFRDHTRRAHSYNISKTEKKELQNHSRDLERKLTNQLRHQRHADATRSMRPTLNEDTQAEDAFAGISGEADVKKPKRRRAALDSRWAKRKREQRLKELY
jgi:hypothetical protein